MQNLISVGGQHQGKLEIRASQLI